MIFNIGDITVVDQDYDEFANKYLFYLTGFSNGKATGYLRTNSQEEIQYSCPLSKVTRVARVITWKDSAAS